jgi:helix-turn-helix, Psq domain.
MQRAILSYKKKQFQSIAAAAEVFGVPKETLRDRLHGVKPRMETHANGHRLTVLEEEVLAKRLLYADKRGFSIRPEFLRGMAQILLRERTGNPIVTLGINWASKFVKRHPALRTRYNRKITYQRTKQEDPKVLKQWFKTVHQLFRNMVSIRMISRTLMKLAL